MGREVGIRKCKDCERMHKPGRDHCPEWTCLPTGCPRCQKYDCLDMVLLRAKNGIKVRATCKNCGVVYHWMNANDTEMGLTI